MPRTQNTSKKSKAPLKELQVLFENHSKYWAFYQFELMLFHTNEAEKYMDSNHNTACLYVLHYSLQDSIIPFTPPQLLDNFNYQLLCRLHAA